MEWAYKFYCIVFDLFNDFISFFISIVCTDGVPRSPFIVNHCCWWWRCCYCNYYNLLSMSCPKYVTRAWLLLLHQFHINIYIIITSSSYFYWILHNRCSSSFILNSLKTINLNWQMDHHQLQLKSDLENESRWVSQAVFYKWYFAFVNWLAHTHLHLL